MSAIFNATNDTTTSIVHGVIILNVSEPYSFFNSSAAELAVQMMISNVTGQDTSSITIASMVIHEQVDGVVNVKFTIVASSVSAAVDVVSFVDSASSAYIADALSDNLAEMGLTAWTVASASMSAEVVAATSSARRLAAYEYHDFDSVVGLQGAWPTQEVNVLRDDNLTFLSSREFCVRRYFGEVPVGTNELFVSPETRLSPFSHFLVYTMSALVEQTTPSTHLIDDMNSSVSSLVFFDKDLDPFELGGGIDWDEPTRSSRVESYLVYFARTPFGSRRSQIGDTLARGTNEAVVPAETPKLKFTTVAVYTMSSLVEQTTPVYQYIVDSNSSAHNGSFPDQDLDLAELGGDLFWSAPRDVRQLTHYVVYIARLAGIVDGKFQCYPSFVPSVSDLVVDVRNNTTANTTTTNITNNTSIITTTTATTTTLPSTTANHPDNATYLARLLAAVPNQTEEVNMAFNATAPGNLIHGNIFYNAFFQCVVNDKLPKRTSLGNVAGARFALGSWCSLLCRVVSVVRFVIRCCTQRC
jgi:hypothetical protein